MLRGLSQYRVEKFFVQFDLLYTSQLCHELHLNTLYNKTSRVSNDIHVFEGALVQRIH